MSIRAALYHLTHYRYDRPARISPQIIRLHPAPHSRTKVLSHALNVAPAQHFVNLQHDPYGNFLARFVFPEPVVEFKIEVDLVAEMSVYNPFDFFVEPLADQWPFPYADDFKEDLAIYLKPEPVGPLLQDLLGSIDRTPRDTVDFVVALNARIAQDIDYVIRMEPGVQTPVETLAVRHGSFRDSSGLLVQACRSRGIAARFVSGYLIQLKPDVTALNALGTQVDEALAAGDVRLTMGGEPTFVSIDDFEAEEWNTAAVEPAGEFPLTLDLRRPAGR